jgi:hypothetical protein
MPTVYSDRLLKPKRRAQRIDRGPRRVVAGVPVNVAGDRDPGMPEQVGHGFVNCDHVEDGRALRIRGSIGSKKAADRSIRRGTQHHWRSHWCSSMALADQSWYIESAFGTKRPGSGREGPLVLLAWQRLVSPPYAMLAGAELAEALKCETGSNMCDMVRSVRRVGPVDLNF